MNFELIKYAVEELKFVKKLEDLKIIYNQKMPFFISKIIHNPLASLDVPLTLQIEPTNLCNLNCICCSRNKMKREKGFMDFGLFKSLIDNASDIGVKRIQLYLHGEPFLHLDIVEMIHYIKLKKIGVTIATNGMLLDSNLSEGILNAGVNSSDYLTFSVLGVSREVHEKIMRGVDHNKVIENILYLLELRKNLKVNGPIIETIFYKMPENKMEENQFKKNWNGVVDHVRVVGKISEQFASYQTGSNPIPLRNKICRNLWERMTIYWNGLVTICIADLDGVEVYGDVKKNKIADVWKIEKLLKIKALHKEKKYEDLKICSQCDW